MWVVFVAVAVVLGDEAAREAHRAALRELISLRTEQRLRPAFRWAQNASRIFVEIKFSHTLSAPAATDAAVERVVVEPRGLKVSATSKRGRWELALDRLWGEVDGVYRDADSVSAGRLTLALGKAATSALKWPRLVECGLPMPSNSALWLDMQEALGGLDDEGDDEACSTLAEVPAPPPPPPPPVEGVSRKQQKSKGTTTDKKRRIKAFKKKAAAARKAVSEETKRRKREIDAAARAASFRVREDVDARLFFLDAPPPWLPIPMSLVVRDGAWDLFIFVLRARKGGVWSLEFVVLVTSAALLLVVAILCARLRRGPFFFSSSSSFCDFLFAVNMLLSFLIVYLLLGG